MSKKMETDQFAELMSAVARSLPRDMDTTTVQGWITNQDALTTVLRDALMPPVQRVHKTTPGPHSSAEIAAIHGFTVIEDVEPSKFNVRDLVLVPFLKEGETGVKGRIMRERAVGLEANLGLVDAQSILNHEDQIYVGMRRMKPVFSGTLLRDQNNKPCVAYMHFDGSWNLCFASIDYGVWGGDSSLLRLKK
jgi:hypothetical protein